ncbi:MAG: class I adenylate-forming enzyme family protein [bacterium]
MTINNLLETRTQQYPEKTFLYFDDREITFRELNDMANRVGNGLADLGVSKGEKVCLLIRNRPEFLYAFFGTMKIGAVSVPINFNLKAEEVKYILQNAEASTLITESSFMEMIGQIQSQCPKLRTVLVLDGKRTARTVSFNDLFKASPQKPEVRLQDSDWASIIYTSGTTGQPKGVILSHRNYLFDTQQTVKLVKLTPEDRFLCILPLFHVNGQVVTTLSPMYAGASMILTTEFKPNEFFSILSKYKATAFSGVPTVYTILLNLPDAEMYDLSSLRMCICGAAPMPVEVFKKFEEKFNAFILEGYGLSEGTCVSSVNPLDGKRKIGSIGLPIPEQEMKILDDQDRERLQGEVGEIVIRGENVMVGYYKNPEATAEALKNGWLHTGDLGYVDPDGYFYIVGRKKEMIIRGGENIYPKEIEEVLYRHPKIAEAAVVGLPDKIWGEEVGAFIVLKPGESLTDEEVINYCKAHLADFKCPRRVVFTDAFPKTTTGKIQKTKLREFYSKP